MTTITKQLSLRIMVLLLVSVTIFSCTTNTKPEEIPIQKTWLGRTIDFGSIRNVQNNYHMFDSTGSKVGAMVFATFFEDGLLKAIDTSVFDDGSVYETALFTVDTSSFAFRSAKLNMELTNMNIDIDFEKTNNKLKGKVLVTKDTASRTIPIDSAYTYDVVRSELYMLLQTFPFGTGDTLDLQAYVPSGMSVSSIQLIYLGEESITINSKAYQCDVIHLKTDGQMPENKIWISKAKPRKMVRFYVPGPELSIELQESVGL